MKKIILIALLGVFSLACFSQVTIESPTDSKGNTAGFYTKRAGDLRNDRTKVVVAGSIATLVFAVNKGIEPKTKVAITSSLGAITCLAWIVMETMSNNSLVRAGRLMDGKEGLTLKTHSGNLGLAYNF